jgi:hypothetical protein
MRPPPYKKPVEVAPSRPLSCNTSVKEEVRQQPISRNTSSMHKLLSKTFIQNNLPSTYAPETKSPIHRQLPIPRPNSKSTNDPKHIHIKSFGETLNLLNRI